MAGPHGVTARDTSRARQSRLESDAEAMPDKNLLFDTYKQKAQSQAPAQVAPG